MEVLFHFDQPVGKLVQADDENDDDATEDGSMSSKSKKALTINSKVIPWVPNGTIPSDTDRGNGHVEYTLQKFVKKLDPRDATQRDEIFEAFGVLSKVDNPGEKVQVQFYRDEYGDRYWGEGELVRNYRNSAFILHHTIIILTRPPPPPTLLHPTQPPQTRTPPRSTRSTTRTRLGRSSRGWRRTFRSATPR